MKKKDIFAKFEASKLEEKATIKGGFRAAPSNPGGSGGSSWIDWGDMDVRLGRLRDKRLGMSLFV